MGGKLSIGPNNNLLDLKPKAKAIKTKIDK